MRIVHVTVVDDGLVDVKTDDGIWHRNQTTGQLRVLQALEYLDSGPEESPFECPHCKRWDHLTCPHGIDCHDGPCPPDSNRERGRR